MREFFKQELKTLHLKTGLQQYFKLQEMEDWEKQFEILLNSLVFVCKEFAYIPDEAKQKIISESILKDQGFTSLNSRTVYGWLNAHKGVYWKTEANYQEFKGDKAPKEVSDEWCEKWKAEVMKVGKVTTPVNMNQANRDVGNTIVTGKEYIRHKQTKTPFYCEGIEIYAADEAEAKHFFKLNFGRDPKTVTLQGEEREP